MGFNSQNGVTIIRSQPTAGVLAADIDTKGVALRNTSGAMRLNREPLVPDPEIGGGRDTSDALLGPASCTGEYEAYGRFGSSFATILKAALGLGVSAPGSVTGTHSHIITPSDSSSLPLLSIYERISSGLETATYRDCVVDSVSINVDASGFLTVSFSIIGKRQQLNVVEIDPTTLYDNTGMTVGTNVVATMGGVNIKPKSLTWELSNNIDADDFRLGQFFLEDLTPKRRESTLTMRLRHEDRMLLRQANLGAPTATEVGGLTTKSPLSVEIQSYEEIDGATTPTMHSLTLDFPSAMVSPFALEPSGDDVLENDVEFRTLRPNMAVPLLTAEFINGVAELA